MKQKIMSALVLLIAPLLTFQAAQAFPDRPVKLVVPTPAGGPPDIMARLLSDKIGAALGQSVIVENRRAERADDRWKIGAWRRPRRLYAADRRTSAVIIAPLVHKNAGYNAETFAPVAGLSSTTESVGPASVG